MLNKHLYGTCVLACIWKREVGFFVCLLLSFVWGIQFPLFDVWEMHGIFLMMWFSSVFVASKPSVYHLTFHCYLCLTVCLSVCHSLSPIFVLFTHIHMHTHSCICTGVSLSLALSLSPHTHMRTHARTRAHTHTHKSIQKSDQQIVRWNEPEENKYHSDLFAKTKWCQPHLPDHRWKSQYIVYSLWTF